MGVAPDGSVEPNGTDFWWDTYPGNTGNCWYGNNAGAGQRRSRRRRRRCPTAPTARTRARASGTGDPGNEGELVGCLLA